jgi:GGDEF domain-containing protein
LFKPERHRADTRKGNRPDMRDDSTPPRSPAGRRRSSTLRQRRARAQPTDLAPRSAPGRATIVDPTRFAAEVDDDIDRRRSGGPNAAVASIEINGIADLRGRFGALFVFDVISDLVRLLHAQLRPGDVYCVGEDGHVLVIGRGHAVEDTIAVVRDLCRAVANRRWDDDGEHLRLTASAGVSTLDEGGSAADVVGCAVDARLRTTGARSKSRDQRTGTVWSLGRIDGAGHESPRRVRGRVVADTGPVTSSAERSRPSSGDDVFSLMEFRPQPESTRLTTAMVLPPQGSAMGIPLLAAVRRAESRTGQAPGVGASERLDADDDAPTHTKATLDAIQASLASHAAAALAAFDASLGYASEDESRASGLAEPVDADESFELPVRRRSDHGVLPKRRVGGGVRRS